MLHPVIEDVKCTSVGEEHCNPFYSYIVHLRQKPSQAENMIALLFPRRRSPAHLEEAVLSFLAFMDAFCVYWALAP